ncbi:flagellar basal body rod protein FlgB [Pseudoalteromonas tunicata]|jgi:flagellar basal-body rod protein FlgB|uniref:Flagellar basal body rod protein FlgB n=1 Tax=Pseudoalteromonas tunicata D2 TaxID=87626 RepID=A4C6H2_9GAMM|nr:flagellar basal body rod protein FlgB [Pseudoalteromonas tunicata]ATC95550.1 flagellar basal-body rod protein FlgB [Pseudoalteromonas tunicata]AXT31123.1 flagellar basal body rod protein FlgB [Pseudoalteromonas tunicata]EAR29576.1 flagellar basal-body rod protein FlgB [Pseudoalteromonas tunicata D2]MDP4982902.1 flagellar basal body rod protein FlgB [Pseudoalteromonas tunicata]MDP5212477.1 flagellar basal body rod protein FlgB [Pseudoalteromonas tunicata]
MAISFDKAFGIHPNAMLARVQRAEVLASNIANADTPGYKAKDIDFAQALKSAKSAQSSQLSRTHEKHFSINTSSIDSISQFRNPNQPDTGDGNSVDVQVERNLYVQNSIEYQASLRFMTGKIQGLKKALGSQGA